MREVVFCCNNPDARRRRTKPIKPDVLRESLGSFVLRKEALGGVPTNKEE